MLNDVWMDGWILLVKQSVVAWIRYPCFYWQVLVLLLDVGYPPIRPRCWFTVSFVWDIFYKTCGGWEARDCSGVQGLDDDDGKMAVVFFVEHSFTFFVSSVITYW